MEELILTWMLDLQPKAPWRDTYERTAQVIAEASAREPLFEGPDASLRTAATLVALSWFESRFDEKALGDHQRSCGLFQIQPATAGKSCDELQDPATATKEALRLMRVSFKTCAARAFTERLAWYTGGACDRGALQSRHRLQLAQRLARSRPKKEEASR